MKKKQFLRAQENSQTSNLVKSTRRILFNHLYESIEDRGHFHVDQNFGEGTGILIRKNGTYFLLTARHVIGAATQFEFSNESPFWITAKNKFNVKTIFDFLMPAKIYHIGELIAGRGVSIDTSDLILIELFQPYPLHLPDHFLDFDARYSPLLPKEKFFEGQLLLAAGFPFELNSFSFFDQPRDGFTHMTNVQRQIVDGVCMFQNGEPYMEIPKTLDKRYPKLSGMSGGLVTNVQPKANQVQALGVILSAGPTIIRFVPSYLVGEAIERFEGARQTIVDPAATQPANLEKAFEVLVSYAQHVENGNV